MCVFQGASVLRMLEGFMGDEEFRQGISNFLKRFSYDNAVTLVSIYIDTIGYRHHFYAVAMVIGTNIYRSLVTQTAMDVKLL